MIALLGALAFALTDIPARWLVLQDPSGPVDAVVVLAGDPDYERTALASSLVVSGQARWLVLTGGEWLGPGDSAYSLRKKALELGVAPRQIQVETGSRTTQEALTAVFPILRRLDVQSVALVTSPYHQRRAFWTARRAWAGLRILNRPAEPSSWSPRGWWRKPRSRRIVLSEYAKLLYYGVRGWI